MKKKILICFQNYYVLNQYKEEFKKLSNYFNITLIISNFLVDKSIRKNLLIFKNETKLQNLFILPFYSNKLDRSFLKILSTHIYLNFLKRKINFDTFDCCITDNKFFIWNRIILEKFLNQSCIQVGINHSGTTMPIEKFDELLKGADIYKLVKSMHKLREVKSKTKIKKKLLDKISDVKNSFLDRMIDRRIVSYMIYKRDFSYNELDLNTGSETNKFDYKITFFYSSFYFWSKWYNNKKVFLCKTSSECNCNNKAKNKILFIGSGKIFVKPFNTIENYEFKMDKIAINIANFLKKMKSENKDLYQLEIKHHPRILKENKELFELKIAEKIKKLISIKYIDENISVTKIACKYKIAFGPVSSALKYLETCKNIKVYCLKSLSNEKYGDKYFLKLLNEKIVFYDEVKIKEDEKYKLYKNLVKDQKVEIFSSLIYNLCKQ